MKTILNRVQRQQAIAWVLTLTENTRLAPRTYERQLLEGYTRGELPLEAIPELLASGVHHLLYRSRATHLFSAAQLTEIITHAHPYNTYCNITGILWYGDGQFVQVLEGPEDAVLELYAAIRQDPRHEQVETLYDAAGPTRWFADWRMALTCLPPATFHGLLAQLDARQPSPDLPSAPLTEPHLLTLLQAFSCLSPL